MCVLLCFLFHTMPIKVKHRNGILYDFQISEIEICTKWKSFMIWSDVPVLNISIVKLFGKLNNLLSIGNIDISE